MRVRPGVAIRIAVLLAVPLLLLLAGRLAGDAAGHADAAATERRLERQADLVRSAFASLLEEAGDVAARATRLSPEAARAAASGPLADRLDGAGVLLPDGVLASWVGTPAAPSGAEAREDRRFRVRTVGLWTRLLAASPRDGAGRSGFASFLLDGPAPDESFAALLPGTVDRGALVHVEFVGSATGSAELRRALGGDRAVFPKNGAARLFLPLAPEGGDVLALATLEAVPDAQRALERYEQGREAAALAFALLLLVLFPWARWVGRLPGLAAALAAVAAARLALLGARVPAQLLPRELGSPTLYGSSAAGGLFGSPADFLLTNLALLAAALVLAAWLRRVRERRSTAALLASAASGLTLTVVVVWLAGSLAADARVPVLQMGVLWRSPGHAALLLGLAVAVAATARLLGLLRPAQRSPAVGAAVAALPVAALAAWTIAGSGDRLAADRLLSEFAPQVLEQSARRRVALVATLREAGSSERAAQATTAPPGADVADAAFLLWSGADLFHAGYQSSLDLYDSDGVRRSHFGFNLPPLEETVPVPPAIESIPVVPALEIGPTVRDESFREGARELRLLHAELPIFQEGRPVGIVVGHVLDEPENLPFLPGSVPYLAALGFGASSGRGDDLPSAPAYVVYDREGTVLLSTLAQPPAASAELRAAALRREAVRLDSLGEPYVALPLGDGPRLHLVLLAVPSWLERLGGFVRLTLLVLAVLVVVAALERRARPWLLVRSIRESFYRKLLAALLVASAVPVVGLSLLVRGYIERRAQVALVDSSTRLATVAKRVVEDYAASADDNPGTGIMNDEILHWLRRVVGQEIHVFENGSVIATSKRELFSSGLLPARLPGEADARLVRGGQPYLVLDQKLGRATIPVAYAAVRLRGERERPAVAGVPLVLQPRQIARAVDRVTEMLLLSSVVLIGLLAATAAALARTVARPVREIAAATRRIASGDYSPRLKTRTRDEVADLVEGFHAMAAALAAQRADLERRRDYIETLLRNATTGVVSTDARGTIVTLNPAASALLAGPGGAPRAGEEIGASLGDEADLTPLREALRRRPTGEGDVQEVDIRAAGRPRRLRLARVPLADPDPAAPEGRLLLVDDVTDLMRSNQLAAWAEMARAIAHEIKNPLTPIQLSAEHLERMLRDRGAAPSAEVQACLETIKKQVRTLREIAGEFSAYAKLPDLLPVPTSPSELLRDTIAPYRAGLPPGIELVERYEETPRVALDRRVVARALVNLIENALQAMGERGVLTVSASLENGEVVLAVGDTGPGLDPAVRDRLFEPYFSTKSSGTGLGLAIARRAVEAHRGRVEVESRPGQGTVFRLRLPVE